MKVFWARFFSFSVLWLLLIGLGSTNIPISILFFAIALALFFLLSLKKFVFLLCISLAFLLFIHSYFVADYHSLSVLMFVFLVMDASFYIGRRKLIGYIIFLNVLIFILMYQQKVFSLELMLFCVFIYVLIFLIHEMHQDRQEQKELYEELFGEYRKLKRMNMQLEHNARLEERTKIARDIHDSVGHRLTALIMKLEVLSIQTKSDEYNELKSMAKDSLEETRHAVKALQSEENEGLSTVVHLIRKLEAESHILVQLTIKQGVLSIPLSNQKNVVLYRVIQESLTNAMRHADSREVQVILGKSATEDLSFEIKNAVHQSKDFVHGFGLANMKQRVEDVKGRINIYQTEKEFIVFGTIPSEGE